MRVRVRRPRAHDGVGVEVDPRSEEAADASEGVVEPREVCGRVHLVSVRAVRVRLRVRVRAVRLRVRVRAVRVRLRVRVRVRVRVRGVRACAPVAAALALRRPPARGCSLYEARVKHVGSRPVRGLPVWGSIPVWHTQPRELGRPLGSHRLEQAREPLGPLRIEPARLVLQAHLGGEEGHGRRREAEAGCG